MKLVLAVHADHVRRLASSSRTARVRGGGLGGRAGYEERLNRCRVAVVLGRWVYSLVCEPAYRPMRWLVSQRTPWPLSRGFSRGPLSFLLPAVVVFCRHHFCGELGPCACVYLRACEYICTYMCCVRVYVVRARAYTCIALHRAR